VPEVIDEGVSGFIVDSLEQAVEAVGRAGAIPRRGVRAAFEKRFTSRRMAEDYVALYRRLTGSCGGDGRAQFEAKRELLDHG